MRACLAEHGLAGCVRAIGAPTPAMRVRIGIGETLLEESWSELRRAWSATSYHMRRLRDDPPVRAGGVRRAVR